MPPTEPPDDTTIQSLAGVVMFSVVERVLTTPLWSPPPLHDDDSVELLRSSEKRHWDRWLAEDWAVAMTVPAPVAVDAIDATPLDNDGAVGVVGVVGVVVVVLCLRLRLEKLLQWWVDECPAQLLLLLINGVDGDDVNDWWSVCWLLGTWWMILLLVWARFVAISIANTNKK